MENLDNNVVENNEVQETKVEVKEEKTFTQAEVDEIVTKRLARETKKIEAEKEKSYQAKLEAERLESEKLSKMNEVEKAKALAEKREKQLREREEALLAKEREIEQERISRQTMQMLGERRIPVELAQFITSQNADEIMDNVNTFEKCFNEAVEKVVNDRLKSKTPIASSTNKNEITKEQFRKMNILEQSKIFNENPALYAELTK